jgi:hypothetical protein
MSINTFDMKADRPIIKKALTVYKRLLERDVKIACNPDNVRARIREVDRVIRRIEEMG